MFRWRRSHLHRVHPHVGRGENLDLKGFHFKFLFIFPGEGVPGASGRVGYDADCNAGAGISLRRAPPLPRLSLYPPRRVHRPQDVRGGGTWALPWWGAGEGGGGRGDWPPDQNTEVRTDEAQCWNSAQKHL